MQHRSGSEHLGIEQRAARQQAMEEPAVPVGPFHHRGDGETPRPTGWRFFLYFRHLITFYRFGVVPISGSFWPILTYFGVYGTTASYFWSKMSYRKDLDWTELGIDRTDRVRKSDKVQQERSAGTTN
jgi:hypothetical protein